MAATFPKPGPAGPPGPPGVSGGSPQEFDIAVPQSSFAITHNLNRPPTVVTAWDTAGNQVELGVQVIDPNTVQLSTEPSLPFSGKVLVI